MPAIPLEGEDYQPDTTLPVDSDGSLKVYARRGPKRKNDPKPMKAPPIKARITRLVTYSTDERNKMTILFDPPAAKALMTHADRDRVSINQLVRFIVDKFYDIKPEYSGIKG